MERSGLSPPEEGWRKKSTKLIVAKGGKLCFLRNCSTNWVWAIVGVTNDYHFNGVISAAKRTFNFFRTGLTITVTDLSASCLKPVLEPENTQSVRAEFANKAYDLVDGEGIRFSVEKSRLIIIIYSFKKVLRKFVVGFKR